MLAGLDYHENREKQVSKVHRVRSTGCSAEKHVATKAEAAFEPCDKVRMKG